jgi:nitrate reductase assembly molybdenum cofactor insertion protein NarJ
MTEQELSKMISEFLPYPANGQHHALKQFAKLVAAAEREACAKLLDEMAAADKLSNYYQVAALRIRERGAP